uniref:NADH dehydrogenase subunit 3 n=1 Tax=Bulinus globosus TaxID=157967 RepID=UPI001EDE874E|nr:NADH dehydrogenase subunit 3 [Bulinus globosus]QYJ56676.1 NADH dehydrogenase subunit 3 [Bulinus globosus]
MLMFFLFVFLLSTMMLFFSWVLSYKSINNSESLTPFECGFEPLSNMRSPFSIRFFLLIILFLIFDIEISLIFPIISMLILGKKIETILSFMMFLIILLFGIFHEWNEGAIDWVTI